jgi:hypothetical protein
MDATDRIRLSLLVMAFATGTTALVSAFLASDALLGTLVAATCSVALLAAFILAYRRQRFTRVTRLVVLFAPVPIAVVIGPNALGLPLVATIAMALCEGRRPTAIGAWYSVVALIALAAQPRDEALADLAVLPGYAFVLLLLAHLTATLRRSWDDRDELHRRLLHQARHDQLTGLPNRTVLAGAPRRPHGPARAARAADGRPRRLQGRQ